MASARGQRAREAEVWACLERVDDPELDEPITDMGFVERVTVGGTGAVEVDFRLPTYWCSPNFAFLMADAIHREVSALAWVERVRVRLEDHMWGEEIAAGINAGRSFAEIFGDLADGEDLGELRAKFEAKAFKRRQEAVLLGLRALGRADAEIVAMDLASLDAVAFPPGEAAKQKPRYRALLAEAGARGAARGSGVPDPRRRRAAGRRLGRPSGRSARGTDQHGIQRRALPGPGPGALPGESARAGADPGRLHAGAGAAGARRRHLN